MVCHAAPRLKKRSSSEGDLSTQFQHAEVEVGGYGTEVSVTGAGVYRCEVGVVEGIEGLEPKLEASFLHPGSAECP